MAITAIAAGVSVASSILGFGSRRKARKRQRAAEALAAKRSAIINVQSRRAAAAAIRRQQALQRAGAITNGMAGGSGDSATRSSIQSQGIASLATQEQQIQLGADINQQIAAANKYSTKAGDYAAVGQLAGAVGSLATTLQSAPAPVVPGLAPQLPTSPT